MSKPRLLALSFVAISAAMLGTQDVSAQATVEAAIGTAVVEREIQGAGDEFSTEIGQLFCWSRVTGAADTTIQHVWIHGPHEVAVDLSIGGSPWRTYSSRNIPPEWTGEWRVEIRDGDGNVLDTQTFTIG